MADDPSDCQSALPLLVRSSREAGIHLTEDQTRIFALYCRRLRAANERINLTAMRSPSQIISGLFLASLLVSLAFPPELLDKKSDLKVVDIGTGAGIPGVPLKILFPRWTLTLIESVGKKARFLDDLISELPVGATRVRNERAETAGRDPILRDAANLCLARAVAPLPTLIEWCAPLTAPGGWMAFPKGAEIDTELNSARSAAAALNVKLLRVVPLPDSPGLEAPGVVVLYRKTDLTPSGYPRRVGLAKLRPIG